MELKNRELAAAVKQWSEYGLPESKSELQALSLRLQELTAATMRAHVEVPNAETGLAHLAAFALSRKATLRLWQITADKKPKKASAKDAPKPAKAKADKTKSAAKAKTKPAKKAVDRKPAKKAQTKAKATKSEPKEAAPKKARPAPTPKEYPELAFQVGQRWTKGSATVTVVETGPATVLVRNSLGVELRLKRSALAARWKPADRQTTIDDAIKSNGASEHAPTEEVAEAQA